MGVELWQEIYCSWPITILSLTILFIIGGLGFWLVGYGIAFGEGDNGFIGTTYFASIGVPITQYPHMFFQVNSH